MNINNLQSVNRLYKIRVNCETAIANIDRYLEDDTHKDPGGEDGFNEGYHSYLSSHSDGSGEITDMTGCYVGRTVAEATRAILKDQIINVNARLELLKVEV